MAIDPRFLADSGSEVFTGNELLVKGCLETPDGVQLYTGYPGSPIASFFDTLGGLSSLLQERGVRAFQSNNEALAAAALNGSQMVPCRGIIAMKSVGVHVAADALALGTLAGAHPQGGAVVIMGDDPWCDSTQVPTDSRFICEHLRMLVVEPGTLQELKDWIGKSFELSRSAGLYVGYIVTTALADGGGTVTCKPNQFATLNTNQRIALESDKVNFGRLLLPPRTWQEELKIADRYSKTMQTAREIGINRIIPTADGQKAPLGFVTTGVARPYLHQVLRGVGLDAKFPILQMGMSYPPDVNLLVEFAELCDKIIVIEERRSFLEKGLRDGLFTHRADVAADVSARLYGKAFPDALPAIPDTRGLNPSVLATIILPLIQKTESIPAPLRNGKLSAELATLRKASKPKLDVVASQTIVPRTPTFCPGCPHRDSSAALLDLRKNLADPAYMKSRHNRGPIDLIAHGDTGCYTMLMFAPTEQLMHNYSGMGLGGGTGSGIDPFITNKQIVFMGDGTFFHSGQIAISNAVQAGQDITFIILENKTTAMTGHQDHPGTELDLLGNQSYIQDIEQVCRGMAGTSPLTVVKLRPDHRGQYVHTLENAILADGVKVVIADKECGITHNRTVLKAERKAVRKHGYLPKKTHMNVTPEVCENCLECTRQTACPGLTAIDTDYGRKIDTDLTWCVNDGACMRVQVSNDQGLRVKPCPSFEQVTVVRKKRRRYMLPHLALDKLPEPDHVHDLSQNGDAWRCHMAGVGGMGIGVVNAILVRAGHKEGYRVQFQDRKGLAIRNGGVYSQVTFFQGGDPGEDAAAGTGAIPYGRADLLLGIDILEAARATEAREPFRVASPERTYAVLNTHKQSTVYNLLGKQDFDPDGLRERVAEACRPDSVFAKNLSELCEQRLGSKQFMNIMMMGVAFQLGLIPVSAHSIAWSIKDTIRRDHRTNLKAFNIGRKLALEPRALPNKPEPVTWEQLVTNKSRILRRERWFGRSRANRFEQLVHGAVKQMRDLPEPARYDLAVRIYDTLQYQDHRFAHQYIEQVRRIYRQDTAARGYAATHAAIWNLAKVMLIKDEPYVAYLLTRPEKRMRDNAKYGVDESNGDCLVYRHHTSPEFNVGPWRVRLKIDTRDWQLKLVRDMKWWRRLPGWHKREVEFREWYMAMMGRVNLSHDEAYDRSLRILKSPETVTGYREIRYPKMADAKALAEAELTRLPKAPATSTPTLLERIAASTTA